MTAHTDTATSSPSTSNKTEAQDADLESFSRPVLDSASNRSKFNIHDTERLNILMTYQTHESTGHRETPDPLEEVETLRRKIESARKRFKTQMTLEMARAELAKRKLAQNSTTPVVKRNHILREMDEGMEKWFHRVEQMKSG